MMGDANSEIVGMVCLLYPPWIRHPHPAVDSPWLIVSVPYPKLCADSGVKSLTCSMAKASFDALHSSVDSDSTNQPWSS